MIRFSLIILFTLIFIFLSGSYLSLCDAPESWQMSLQDPATPIVEGMIFFHNYLCFFLILVGVSTFWVLWTAINSYNEVKSNLPSQKFTHSSILETIWTILPAMALLLIAIPSFALLYSLDELIDPALTLKVVGSQWFWSYEYSDTFFDSKIINVPSLNFDSYMISTDELEKGSLRLLEVDNRVTLPIKTHIRVLVTATDVLHSWAIPAFGIKIDACPGRLSQSFLFIKRTGTFYGQCSEICGVNHGFMPIVIQGVSVDSYTRWMTDKMLYLSENK